MNLAPLLAPRSVAVVGATERPASYAGDVMRNLVAAGFDGPVWGVNPNRETVLGFECVPTVADLPQAVDAVVVAIPAAGVPDVVAAAGARGCGGAIVLSAGFGEIEPGRELEAKLAAAARTADLPVCGPNGNGIVAARSRAPLWGDSVSLLEPGPVAMITQSGNVGVNALGSRRGIGWHTVVSTGNQTVCDASDWLSALAEAEGVRSVALFLESDGDGAKLTEALAACAERGIGVAVLKVGASQAGVRAAAAHTGALAGDHRVFRALVDEAGAAWASDPHELLELARALAHPRARPRGDGDLAVLTCSGGDSGVAGDAAQELGIALPSPGPETTVRLDELLPEGATIANPLDYTALIWYEPDRLRRIVAAVGDDPAIDQLLLLYDHPRGLSPEAEPSWKAIRSALVAGALDAGVAPILASTLPDLVNEGVGRELSSHGVPAVAGLRTALACARALRRAPGNAARLREIAAAARAGGAGDASPNGWLGEAATKAALDDAGIEVPAGRVCESADDCAQAAAEIGYPVAVKLNGPGIRHKSDVGGIELGIGGEDELRLACARVLQAPAADGAELLVERMVDPGVELVVSATTAGVVPALVVGLGGVWTEALDDVAVVPLPASTPRIERALRSLRGAPLLSGSRGRSPADIASAARLAERTGRLLLDSGLSLIELNPVAALPDRAVALDALARR